MYIYTHKQNQKHVQITCFKDPGAHTRLQRKLCRGLLEICRSICRRCLRMFPRRSVGCRSPWHVFLVFWTFPGPSLFKLSTHFSMNLMVRLRPPGRQKTKRRKHWPRASGRGPNFDPCMGAQGSPGSREGTWGQGCLRVKIILCVLELLPLAMVFWWVG